MSGEKLKLYFKRGVWLWLWMLILVIPVVIFNVFVMIGAIEITQHIIGVIIAYLVIIAIGFVVIGFAATKAVKKFKR